MNVLELRPQPVFAAEVRPKSGLSTEFIRSVYPGLLCDYRIPYSARQGARHGHINTSWMYQRVL